MASHQQQQQASSNDQQVDSSSLLSLKHIFDSKELADCCFVFNKEDVSQRGRKRKKLIEHRIPAHKFVLAAHSPVFKAMFYGPIPEKDDEIVITDILPEVFESMLKYIYTGEVISDEEVDLVELFLAVDKYDFGKLLQKVEEKLVASLSIDNAMDMYEFIERFQKLETLKKIGQFIQRHTLLILEHSNFVNIQRTTLNFVLSRQELNAIEIQLFHACMKWAKTECERKSIANPTPSQLRETLGDEFFLIRFPIMTANQFMEGPMASGIFTVEEQTQFLKHILTCTNRADSATSAFIAHFNRSQRKRYQSFSFNFGQNFNLLSARMTVKNAVTSLKLKSNDDFLLNGFIFASTDLTSSTIEFNFTVERAIVMENDWPIFFQEQMPYISTRHKNKKEPATFRIELPWSLLITANRTYKLILDLKFSQPQTFTRENGQTKFTIGYVRKFKDISISIELESCDRSAFQIYQLLIY